MNVDKVVENTDVYMGTICDGVILPVVDGDESGDPKRQAYMVAELSSSQFEAFAKFEYFSVEKDGKMLRAKDMWIDGMQKWIANCVYLCSQDKDEGIFALYYVQNDSDHLSMLGKLVPEDKFTKMIESKLWK